MMQLFHDVGGECSKLTTKKYSTSFNSAIKLLHKDYRAPVYNIYGFVRFADEIVDTFHEYNKEKLLSEFKEETYKAIERKISLNPILHSFQRTVNACGIDTKLIDAFFKSMEYDLCKTVYDVATYKDYVYGSAEVVGLMCLTIFCEKDCKKYESLKPYAQSLGAAFQKVNFLRDVKSDYRQLERTYFPEIDFKNFTAGTKKSIENEIMRDFAHAYIGITELPLKARFGVYVAYKYYLSLFSKIKRTQASKILDRRIRIPSYSKAFILVRAGVKNRLHLI
jgi:15-cis-phytoene synthase